MGSPTIRRSKRVQCLRGITRVADSNKQRSMIHKARQTRLSMNKSGNLELVAEPVQNHISCACGSAHTHQDQTTNSGSTAPQLSNHFVCSTLVCIWKVINGANHVRPIDVGDKFHVVEVNLHLERARCCQGRCLICR